MSKTIQSDIKKRMAVKESFVKKFGFDPRDTSWIEESLASSNLERNWFKFERENPDIPYIIGWDEAVKKFNSSNPEPITTSLAKQFSKKLVRYTLGAFKSRMTLHTKLPEWKSAAIEFEETHRKREIRMNEWSQNHKNKFPKVITNKPVKFLHGPYFRQCIENVPDIFTTPKCDFIKPNIELELISYDPELGYMRFDFTPSVRKRIRPDPPIRWNKEEADYEIWVKPEEKDFVTFLEAPV